MFLSYPHVLFQIGYLRRSLHQMNALTFCDKATNIRVLDVNPFRKESVEILDRKASSTEKYLFPRRETSASE